jgi:DNA-binding NarL/FixJ family response regulator
MRKKNIVPSNPSSRKMNKLRTLIVEDNNFFRKTLRESLQASFPEIAIDEAVNGTEALQKVNAFLPDLILMDLRLPGGSGLGLTKRIKAIFPDVTIFILTSYDTPECREAASRCGADRFIAKDSLNQMRLEELIKSFFRI